ncbi:hypothetical protein IJ579_09190 [bacterium]|nr:hypothetical protein [bacterium]
MKKFLLLLGIVVFTGLGANASTIITYQNTGVPIYVQHGAGPRMSTQTLELSRMNRGYGYRSNNFARPYSGNNFARNHFAQPRGNRPPMPPVGGQMLIGNVPATNVNIVNVNNSNSRFNKNFQPRTQKSYTRGGMIYYN